MAFGSNDLARESGALARTNPMTVGVVDMANETRSTRDKGVEDASLAASRLAARGQVAQCSSAHIASDNAL